MSLPANGPWTLPIEGFEVLQITPVAVARRPLEPALRDRTPRGPSNHLEDHLTWLLDELEPVAAAIKQVCRR